MVLDGDDERREERHDEGRETEDEDVKLGAQKYYNK